MQSMKWYTSKIYLYQNEVKLRIPILTFLLKAFANGVNLSFSISDLEEHRTVSALDKMENQIGYNP